MRRSAVAAALCFAAACGTDSSLPPTAPPLTMEPVPDGVAQASTTCQNVIRNEPKLTPRYRCGEKIRVTSSASQLASAIPAGIAIWNSLVFGHDGFPEFVPNGTAQHTVTLSFEPGTSGTWYCGTTNPNGTTITVYRSSAQTNCNGGFTNVVQESGLPRLIAHELSHAIGFKHISDAGLRRPAADHCVASLPPNGSLNGSLCQAEIELLHFHYGLRDTDIDPSKHIATGLELGGTTAVNVGESGTLVVEAVLFARAAPSLVPPDPTTLKYAWSSDQPSVGQVSAGTGASNAIQGVAAGSTTIRVQLTSSTYERAEPMQGNAVPFTVNAPAVPPPPPTALAASAVTATSATIGWVNGATSGTTTTLQYRKSGVTTWTTASSSIAGGQASFVLSGLAPVQTYDVRAWHVRNGLSSSTTTATGLFTTLSLPAITNFRITACEQRPSGLKTYNYFTVVWTTTPTQPGSSFQIGVQTMNDPAQAAVILTLPGTARTGEVGGYLSSPTTMNRWFWIRYTSGGVVGPWTALLDNPVPTNLCAL